MNVAELNNISNGESLFKKNLNKLSGVQALSTKRDLSKEERAQYEKAARGFESMFVNMLIKQMKSSMLEEKNEEATFGAETLGGYADMLLSDDIAKTGKGIGIAEMVFKQLTGGHEISNITNSVEGYSDLIRQNSIPVFDDNTSEESPIKKEVAKLANSLNSNSLSGRIEQYMPIIQDAARKYGIPENLIKSVIRTESAGKHDAVSPVGAKGLMQLMDGTAGDMGVKDPFDPEQNIMGGTKYLKYLMDRFENDTETALAAYNAGPGNVEKYGGIPPFNETQNYVKKVLNYFGKYDENLK